MEHDFERKIREKVRSAESNSVNWEREMVWSKIDHRSEQNFAYYYVAASILLAGALIFFTIEFNDRKQIDLKLSAIELSIEQNKISQIELLTNNRSPVESACEEDTTAPLAQKRLLASSKKKQTADRELIAKREEDMNEIEKQNELTIAQESAALIEIVKPAEIKPRVQAIIGSNYHDISTKDKKLKFKLFSSEDEDEMVKPASEPITLHSKIN